MAALRKWKPKIANNWMAWCKSDLPGKWLFWVNFFCSKVPEFLHTLFNLVVKHSPVFFGWFALCFWGKTRLTWVTFSGTEFCLKEGQKRKQIPPVPNTMMQRTTNENALVLLCSVHCTHFNTLSKPVKKYRGMFYYLIEKHMHILGSQHPFSFNFYFRSI